MRKRFITCLALSNSKTRALVHRILLVTVVALSICGQAFAHPYLPLRVGDVVELNYDFHVDTKNQMFKSSDTKGKLITTTEPEVEKEGRRYLKFKTSYRDIPYSKEDQFSFRREEDGNVYLAFDLQGKWHETVELPKDVNVGSEWDYNDGERSKRRVTARLELKFGENVFSDCLEVTRVVLNNKRLKDTTNKSYYCRDMGEMKSVFSMPSPVGNYVTTTEFSSHK